MLWNNLAKSKSRMVLWSLLLCAFFAVSRVEAQEPPELSLVSIGTTVGDMERALTFYREVLEFELEYDVEFTHPGFDRATGVFAARARVAGLSLGPSRIELTEFITPRGRDIPADSRSNDHWFQHLALVVTDIEKTTERLRQHNVQLVSPAPQRFPDGRAFLYFRDRDGHPLELAEFPGEKPVNEDKLFQRIDHTAIVVHDLEASIEFYRKLGFQLEHRAESFSETQQRLNNVFCARLEIASLRLPGDAISVELLHYVTPPGGRPFPTNTRPNDLIHRHLTLATDAIAAAFRLVREHGLDLRSPEVSTFEAGALGNRRVFYLADPTGHAIQLVSQN